MVSCFQNAADGCIRRKIERDGAYVREKIRNSNGSIGIDNSFLYERHGNEHGECQACRGELLLSGAGEGIHGRRKGAFKGTGIWGLRGDDDQGDE